MNDRLRELDSLRGIAVLLVMAFHTFKRSVEFTSNGVLHFLVSFTTVGWLGVDIFFTLSGFLITSILLRTREHPHYFKYFYARRILRILPLYFFLISVVLLFTPWLEERFQANLFKIVPVLLLFQQNWAPIVFEFPITLHLAITWSLAIEEQFYLIWPLAVRRLSRSALLKAGAAYIVLSIAARALVVVLFETIGRVSVYQFFYFISFTRFEEMLFGALLAVWLTYPEAQAPLRKYSVPTAVAAVVGFAALVVAAPVPSTPTYGYAPITVLGYTLIALATAAVIAAFATHAETALIRRVFQNRALEFFGQYSYAMYLFHPPVMLLTLNALWHAGLRGAEVFALHVFITFAGTTLVALLTWNLIEKRALSLKRYFEYEHEPSPGRVSVTGLQQERTTHE